MKGTGEIAAPASDRDSRVGIADHTLTVLLIEDDEATSTMYTTRLESDGYSVIVASDGESGLARALLEQPDIIYLDLRLPGLDGFEVLEHLRGQEHTATIPVIILTNYSEPELRQRGLQLGAFEFLVKTETTPARLSQSAGHWARHSARPVTPG
jgi:CheY-like chemotaxis protein